MAITPPTGATAATVKTPNNVDFTAAQQDPAAQMTAAQTAVGDLAQPDATLTSDRLSGLLQQSSPLMQRAATSGKQMAASRGLLSSSMGAAATQGAMIDAMAPIANQDASAMNTMNTTNASAVNQTLSQNTAAKNSAAQSNQAAINAQRSQNAQFEQQANMQEAATEADIGKFNAQQSNAMNQFNVQQKNDLLKQTLDLNNRTDLANIESKYKSLMQLNTSASGIYEQVLKNVSDIQNNKDLNKDTKTASIKAQMTYLNNTLRLLESINGVNNLVSGGGDRTIG